MNARIYDPYLGRFLSADPVLPDPGNSQAYNRYAYVLGNPLKYVDPTGNTSEPLFCFVAGDPCGGGGSTPTTGIGSGFIPGITGVPTFGSNNVGGGESLFQLGLSSERSQALLDFYANGTITRVVEDVDGRGDAMSGETMVSDRLFGLLGLSTAEANEPQSEAERLLFALSDSELRGLSSRILDDLTRLTDQLRDVPTGGEFSDELSFLNGINEINRITPLNIIGDQLTTAEVAFQFARILSVASMGVTTGAEVAVESLIPVSRLTRTGGGLVDRITRLIGLGDIPPELTAVHQISCARSGCSIDIEIIERGE